MDESITWVLKVAYVALGVALCLTLVRMVRGPSLADRVVALDLLAYIFIAFAGVYGMETGYPDLLNVALAVGIFVFLGTIAYARYQEAHFALEKEGEA